MNDLSALTLTDSSGAIAATDTGTVPVSRQIFFEVPRADLGYFATLPASVQAEVRLRLKQMAFIAHAGDVNPACKRLAAQMQTFARGNSWNRLRSLYYQFTRYGSAKFKAGDWRILVNWSKVGGDRTELRPEFVEFWRMLCELHQRATSGARRQLMELWRQRVPFTISGRRYQLIPGYSNWPEADAFTGHPAGWSEGNLYNYTPDKFELVAARIGIQKASSLGYKIRTSRAGLRIGEFMEFDDHEFNVKVNFPGQLRSLRPRCFGAVDVLTDSMFSMVIKPTFWDMEAEQKRVLSEKDFAWFVVAVLTSRGYRADTGTMFLMEHGTATVRAELEQRIADATMGKVRVSRGGRFHVKANPGQFAPPSGGNFRFKPHVEQYWRMLDDWLDQLKGQAGKGRDFAPEEGERLDAYNNKLLKAAQALGVEEAGALILPRLSFDEFCRIAVGAMAQINEDPGHKCVAWEKCGFVTKEFRRQLNAPWQPLALLNGEGEDVRSLVMQSDAHFQVRRLTRGEADRSRIAADPLTTLPFEAIPALVGPEFAGAPVTVRGGKFEFQDWRIGPDPLVFMALDAEGRPLREGERFTPYCNPMSPEVLVITDARGAVVSVCPPDAMPARNDEEGIKAAMGAKAHWTATKLAAQRARHEDAGAGVDFMKRHNAAALERRLNTKHRSTAEGRAAAEEILTPAEAGSSPVSDGAGEEFMESIL